MGTSAARTTLRAAGALAAAGALTLGWALHEARHPVLRRVDVACLAPGEQPLTLLHLADLHLTGATQARVDWVRSLAELEPDIVVDTGDNLSFASGLEPLRQALEPFLALPGAFVLGDHDYHATILQSPLRYLRRDPRTARFWADRAPQGTQDGNQAGKLVELPWREVRELQRSGGWADLTNTRGTLSVRGRSIELVGVDDPHANLDHYPGPASPASPASPAGSTPASAVTEQVTATAAPDGGPVLSRTGRPLRLGLLHAPYTRVLDQMLTDGVDLALAGHTHGGQLCLPGVGALVTNCDIDRRRVSGLSAWPGQLLPAAGIEPAQAPEGSLHLHVSAGLGTSPYTPVRLACPPSATLLTLLPATS